ncbi:MAG: hypothetical protein NZ888_06870 [Candidatus Nitrosocaldus sp.]|nr:hypothetical protein [Candidatus Nitrosocaldus sp.]MDW8000405.1 hypothetical protein [Candidatus Nitrosocaldus sp.]
MDTKRRVRRGGRQGDEYVHKEVTTQDGDIVCSNCGVVLGYANGEAYGMYVKARDGKGIEGKQYGMYIKTLSEYQEEIREILRSMRGGRYVQDNSRYLAELIAGNRDYRVLNTAHIIPPGLIDALTSLYRRATGAMEVRATMLYILILEHMPNLSREDRERVKMGLLAYTNYRNGQMSRRYGIKHARIFRYSDEELVENARKAIYLMLWRNGMRVPLGEVRRFGRITDLLKWLIERGSHP